MTPYWEHFEHLADIGIRGKASSIEQAFEQIAIAMTAVITDPDQVLPSESIGIRCEDLDIELLLLDWINTLIYEMATRRMLFSHFQVTISQGILTATVSGEAIDRHKHQPAVEIKGATFTELHVYQEHGKTWVAQCVVDV